MLSTNMRTRLKCLEMMAAGRVVIEERRVEAKIQFRDRTRDYEAEPYGYKSRFTDREYSIFLLLPRCCYSIACYAHGPCMFWVLSLPLPLLPGTFRVHADIPYCPNDCALRRDVHSIAL